MATGTPSNTIPLGSELLAAMGDVKGAFKAMGEEARILKSDARTAQKELKSAERDAKKANAEIEKLTRKGGTVSQAQKDEAKRLDLLVEEKSAEVFKKSQKSAEANLKVQKEKESKECRNFPGCKNEKQYDAGRNGCYQ